MALSRGKQMLQKCLLPNKPSMDPLNDAKWWIQCGLDNDVFEIKYISQIIGSGVFSKKTFQNGEFLMQFSGQLSMAERGMKGNVTKKGPYQYYFLYDNINWCIDASRAYNRFGRMVNDGGENHNAKMEIVNLPNSAIPYLALFASSKTILPREEIVYNYQDHFSHCPWRQKNVVTHSTENDVDSDPFDLNQDPHVVDSANMFTASDVSGFLKGVDAESIHANFQKDLEYVSNSDPMDTDPPSQIYEVDAESFDATFLKDLEYVPNSDPMDTDSPEIFDNSDTTQVPMLSRFLKDNSDTTQVPMLSRFLKDANSSIKRKPKPRSINMMPSSTKGKPSSTNGKPSSTKGKPSSTKGKPSSTNVKPSSTNGKPSSTNGEPSSTNGKPSSTNVKPSSTIGKPGSINEKPSSINEKPSSTNGKPSSTNGKPSSTNRKPSSTNVKPSSTNGKPSRPCLYCGLLFRDVRRHIKTKHAAEPRVKSIIEREMSGVICRKERIKEFDKMRKEAMLSKNKVIMANGSNDLLCERQSSGKKVMCSVCNGFFKANYFIRHRSRCSKASSSQQVEIEPKLLSAEVACSTMRPPDQSDMLWNKVYSNMKKDVYYGAIDGDETIKFIGKEIFACRKPNKRKEATMKARSAMRRLAKLVSLTEGVTCALELFALCNCHKLENAIHTMCNKDDSEDSVKAGLKIALGTLVKLCCRILIPHFTIVGQKDNAAAVKEFQEVFTAPSYYARIFSSAEYQLKEKRQRDNRKPNALPDEENIGALHLFLKDEIARISSLSIINKAEFIRLRRCTLAYITLFNAKRGSEAARLQIIDFEDRASWIPKEMDEEARDLLKRYSVTFVMGKGDGLVPVFFPSNAIQALNMVANHETRRMAGVSETNKFLFPYTEMSDDGTVGYNEIKAVCELINVPIITATSIRHRASTIIWAMEGVDEKCLNSFMEHLGHHKDIDKNIYACPPALKVLKQVTPILETITQEGPSKLRYTTKPKDRTYIKWSQRATEAVRTTFVEYISGEKGNLYPGKHEILAFKETCELEEVKSMEWQTIKTKIFNEKVKVQGALKKMENI